MKQAPNGSRRLGNGGDAATAPPEAASVSELNKIGTNPFPPAAIRP